MLYIFSQAETRVLFFKSWDGNRRELFERGRGPGMGKKDERVVGVHTIKTYMYKKRNTRVSAIEALVFEVAILGFFFLY